jgi:hypothetical protein
MRRDYRAVQDAVIALECDGYVQHKCDSQKFYRYGSTIAYEKLNARMVLHTQTLFMLLLIGVKVNFLRKEKNAPPNDIAPDD